MIKICDDRQKQVVSTLYLSYIKSYIQHASYTYFYLIECHLEQFYEDVENEELLKKFQNSSKYLTTTKQVEDTESATYPDLFYII